MASAESIIHRIFEGSVLLKGLHALIECAGGVALYLVSADWIAGTVRAWTQSELVEDPNDAVANALLGAAQGLSIGSKDFYALYLLSHGVVKLVLVAGLLANRRWAYPWSLVTLALFIVYQLYRYSYTRGPGLLALTALDLVMIWLVWHEWGRVKQGLPPN